MEMSNYRNIKYFAESMVMMMQIYLMTETSVYETVNSTPSSMADPFTHVI